jgi:hypothetical protein
MIQTNFTRLHPYASDVFEWLRERRRFSNIRHPFRKSEFESKILNEVCAAFGSSIFGNSASPFPSTDCLLATPEHLVSYVRSLFANHKSHNGLENRLEIDLKKAWLKAEDKAQFKLKMKDLLAEFEKSTSVFGEPVSILTIQTDG